MRRNTWIILCIVALVIGGVISLGASSYPDGLERVAEDQGFLNIAVQYLTGIMPDYAVIGIPNDYLAAGLAGIIGTIITFGALYGIGWLFLLIPGAKK